MMIYLLKFLACSGLLVLFYFGILQRERIFRFNRFFLLSIVVLSLVIPFTVVRTSVIEVAVTPQETDIYHQESGQQSFSSISEALPAPQALEVSPKFTIETALWGIYTLISLILLTRFGRNLYAISRLKRNGLIIKAHGIKIVLRKDITASFSFLSYMYTNQTRYEQGALPTEILEHEKHHIVQKHSYDIIFMELVQALLWFNPFVYLIKKAVKLNHEFLADEHF